ncbi:MAG: restriction endonuclease [Treponema sp.]|nr:restriction endonuclease [Treponema sp.]
MRDKPILGYEEAEQGTVVLITYDGSIRYVRHSFKCKYCGIELYSYTTGYPVEIMICKYCGWWIAWDTDGRFPGFSEREASTSLLTGMLKKYDVDSKDVPLNLIRKYLLKYPSDIGEMNTQKFEELICDCFKDYYAPCEVIHIGQSRDKGIDLKLILSNNDTYLVQVKRRKNISKNETVKFVRELNGVLYREGIPKGIFVTTAKGYTKDAIAEIAQTEKNQINYNMKLLAFDDLINMLKITPQNPYEPWNNFVNKFYIKKEYGCSDYPFI